MAAVSYGEAPLESRLLFVLGLSGTLRYFAVGQILVLLGLWLLWTTRSKAANRQISLGSSRTTVSRGVAPQSCEDNDSVHGHR
jgi:hypothetical protein